MLSALISLLFWFKMKKGTFSLFMTGTRAKIFLLLLSTLIGGCEEKINPVEQIGDDLISAHESSKIQGQLATLQSIKNAIRIYYASNGKYPEDLNSIQELMDSPIDPEMYHYNPQNGMITLKGQ